MEHVAIIVRFQLLVPAPQGANGAESLLSVHQRSRGALKTQTVVSAADCPTNSAQFTMLLNGDSRDKDRLCGAALSESNAGSDKGSLAPCRMGRKSGVHLSPMVAFAAPTKRSRLPQDINPPAARLFSPPPQRNSHTIHISRPSTPTATHPPLSTATPNT